SRHERNAGDVAPRPRKARDDSGRHGISAERDDDRYSARLLFGDPCGWSQRHNDVDLTCDQLCGHLWQSSQVAVRPAAGNDEVSALDISEVTKPLTKGLDARVLSTVRTQDAYAVHFRLALRLGGERRGEKAACHGTKECSTLHYSIT